MGPRCAQTPGNFDLHNWRARSERSSWWTLRRVDLLHRLARRRHAVYLFRTRLNGRGKAERVTPRDQPGYHTYRISSDGRWAFHVYSSFGTPPVVELVRLPKHEVVRAMVRNERLKQAVARLQRGPAGFTRVTAADGFPNARS
jgi:hypothetical protein